MCIRARVCTCDCVCVVCMCLCEFVTVTLRLDQWSYIGYIQGGPEKLTLYFVIISTNVAVFPRFFGQGWDTVRSFYCEKHFVHFSPQFF